MCLNIPIVSDRKRSILIVFEQIARMKENQFYTMSFTMFGLEIEFLECPTFNLAIRKRINTIGCMKAVFICPLVLLITLFFYSCENKYRNRGHLPDARKSLGKVQTSSSSEAQRAALAKDAYQVTASEFDEFFDFRFGLLYQKFSDTPFNGRIITIDKGEKGDFVSQDEAWKEGRKHGTSTRWFSNGIKMYERNYDLGKWHGTVTRWWPNGQKMYVRAYTQGKRHGKEATWRSDGTPIGSSGADPTPVTSDPQDLEVAEGEETDALPSISIPQLTTPGTDDDITSTPEIIQPEPVTDDGISPSSLETEMVGDLPAFEPVTESNPELPDLSLPPPAESASSGEPDLPAFPGIDESMPADLPSLSDSPSTPSIDSGDIGDLPPFPGTEAGSEAVDMPSSSESLPELPEMPSDGGLPPLPDGGLPPLPDGGALPPLPDAGTDLPPLPDDGGLPPLPDLP